MSPKNSLKAPITFSFYGISDSTNLPGEEISSRQVIYVPKKEGKQTVRLDSFNIRIPANGMYICIQYIFDRKYGWPMRYVDREKDIDSVRTYYGGRFDGIYSKNFSLAFYDYFRDTWLISKKDIDDPAEIHGTLKWAAEINYCKPN